MEGARRVTLKGLDAEGIADYIELTAGVDSPPPDLAAAILDQTGGNPFFIGEVVRLMAAEGRLGDEEGARREVAIPQGVREVVGRRLDRLSSDANQMLRIAAVYGRDFRLDVVDRICGLSTEEIEAALREGWATAWSTRSTRASTRSRMRSSARRSRRRSPRRSASPCI